MKVKVTRHNGVLKVDIDDKLYTPLSFKSFRPNPRNVSEFYNAGVRLFSVLSSGVTSALGVPYSLYGESWVGDGEYDFAPVDRQMDMFIENAPEAYFAPMIQLDTRDWYLKVHTNVPNSFTHLSQIAHDKAWRRAAADYMKAMMLHLEEKYGDRIYGYFLLCGTTTEWFSEGDFEASHPIKDEAYGETLPSLERLNLDGASFLTKDESDVFDARKFHSETMSNTLLYFAAEAQKILHREKLLGVYYGYLFELGGERIYNDGIFDYEKVFFSDDINMISSPSAYGYRRIDDPSAFMLTAKTLDLHNKLYFLEFDHITHVAPEEITEGRDLDSSNQIIVKIPGADSKCKTETEALNLMYRDFALCAGNLTAMWWFDMFDGWFRSEGMMSAVEKMIRIGDTLSQRATKSISEIAVFAEGESMYRVRKCAGLATTCLSDFRRTLAECGAPYDIYSISDIHNFNAKQYKLLIFLNQYDIKNEVRAKIDGILSESGKNALWLYAPNFATDGALNVNNILHLTNICVSESSVSHGDLIYGGDSFSYLTPEPYFSISDKDATPLAYCADGEVAVAKKKNHIYCSYCNIPSTLLREIARECGVFVYSEQNKLYTYVNSEVIGAYNAEGCDVILNVKEDGTYLDLITDTSFEAKGGRIIIPNCAMNAHLLMKKQERNKK